LYLIRTATRADLDKMIVAAQLPDYALFESLPGAGAQLAPRLIAEVRGNSSGDRAQREEELGSLAATKKASKAVGVVHHPAERSPDIRAR
jgi:Holliday junction resolvasome RuvABC DNA-binding subunit